MPIITLSSSEAKTGEVWRFPLLHENWHDIATGVGTDAGSDFGFSVFDACFFVTGNPHPPFWNKLYRGLFGFDLAPLGLCVINSLELQLYGFDKHDTLVITPDINVYGNAYGQAHGAAGIHPDAYQGAGNVPFSNVITYIGWVVGGWNSFVLNAAGLVAANAALAVGWFWITLRNASYDVADIEPFTLAPLNNSFIRYHAPDDPTKGPKLVVDYTPILPPTLPIHQAYPLSRRKL